MRSQSSKPRGQSHSWIMTGVGGFVKKIRNATQLISLRLGELVAEPYINCPNCKCRIDTSNVSLLWPALPAGVQFDPSDSELLEHLQGKSSLLNSKSHAPIDEFIPTIEEKEGICYTHPKNLPGIKMDGSSLHFFHRVSNAYGCGHRKRRKISGDDKSVCDEHIRWHKTGASKAIYDENGVKKGWKKILVLYRGSKTGGSKIDRDNWVMHQYHLGATEDEADGELVISKVFYQLPSKKNDKSEMGDIVVESEASAKIDPRTPKNYPPQPRLPNNSPCDTDQYTPIQVDQDEEECGTSVCRVKVEAAECSAELSPAVVVANLPASDELRQPRDAPDVGPEPEAPIPAAGYNMDRFHGLPELNTTFPCFGAPSDNISLAGEEGCGASTHSLKVEAAECSAWLAELSPAVVVENLPASNEPRQPRDAPDAGPEASIPVDDSNMDMFHGLPELGTTFPSLAPPSDGISLAVSLSCASSLFA
ncbi:NAC domain-containing protein 8 [Dichanthelium oligosanthes]|uniref:NAC domain-containing protein 8 n=1 Tax=Dichanthelium oligosanthes TaxID=888268 RepID=A0A1E5VQ26_9POAL|nr:NAC domain-containing protein 8 [Dichanthelium oligosanthes]